MSDGAKEMTCTKFRLVTDLGHVLSTRALGRHTLFDHWQACQACRYWLQEAEAGGAPLTEAEKRAIDNLE